MKELPARVLDYYSFVGWVLCLSLMYLYIKQFLLNQGRNFCRHPQINNKKRISTCLHIYIDVVEQDGMKPTDGGAS